MWYAHLPELPASLKCSIERNTQPTYNHPSTDGGDFSLPPHILTIDALMG